MAVGARCGWVVTGVQMTCSSCLFDVCSARYSALSQHASLLPAACPHLSRTTFSRERPSRSQVPTLMSQRTYFAWTEAEQSGECGGVGARGGEEGR